MIFFLSEKHKINLVWSRVVVHIPLCRRSFQLEWIFDLNYSYSFHYIFLSMHDRSHKFCCLILVLWCERETEDFF